MKRFPDPLPTPPRGLVWRGACAHAQLAIGLILLSLAGPLVRAQDCMRWTRRTDVSGPGPQARHAMAYNRDRGTTCLVSAGLTPDVWEYDGTRWTQITIDGPLPQARQGAGLVYDPVRKVLLLVGGLARSSGDVGFPPVFQPKDQPIADAWSFRFTGDGRGFWTREADLPAAGRPQPDPVLDAQLVFDDARSEVLLYGASHPGLGSLLAKPTMLAWNGTHWSESGQLQAAAENALAYDARRHRVISYGGLVDQFDAGEGERFWTAHGHLSLIGPGSVTRFMEGPQRLGHKMVYDAGRDRLVVFGGAYLEGSTSLEDRRTRLYPTPHLEFPFSPTNGPVVNPVLPGPAPEARVYHGMVYDERRRVVVLYGGYDGFNVSGPVPTDTWELGATPIRITQQPPARADTCFDSSTGVLFDPPVDLSVGVESASSFKYEWRWQGIRLGKDSDVHGPRYQISAEAGSSLNSWGYYDVVMRNECGVEVASTRTELRVYRNPAITLQPVTQRVCPGETVRASTAGLAEYIMTRGPGPDELTGIVLRDPSTPLRHEWQRLAMDPAGQPQLGTGVPIPGATHPMLTLPAMTSPDNGFYRCVVFARCARGFSDIIELTAGVWIKVHPASTTNLVCQPVSLSVLASGKGTLRYQWRRNQVSLANDARMTGVNGNQLRFSALRYLDDAEYDCVITDACHSLTSRVASISVQPNPPFLLVDTNGPAPRERPGLVYDSVRGVSVLFGGIGNGQTLASVYPTNTWEYDGTNWTQRFPLRSPSGRTDFGMAFDRHRGRVVLFGGRTHNGFTAGLHSGETWEYDGTNWVERLPANSPPARHSCALFYDPVRRVTTLYGGDTTLPDPRTGDIWTWDGTNWTRKEVAGESPKFGNYGSPLGPQMVWDERRGYAVLPPTSLNTGGPLDRMTWTWDGARWTSRVYEFTGFGHSPAPAGQGLGLAYDRFRGEVIYWSGTGYDQTYLWRWNGSGWRRDDISELVGFHFYSGTTYDERRNSVVQFGGRYSGSDPTAQGYSSRTFERVLADEPVILRQPVLLADPARFKILLRLVAAGAPPLTYEWQRDGRKLTDSVLHAGLTNATLELDDSLAADTGLYHCIVRGRCGEAVSSILSLVPRPSLQLTTLSAPVGGVPGLAIQWSEAGAILEQAPTPAGPWTQVPGARSPFAAALEGSAGFYRLRQQ